MLHPNVITTGDMLVMLLMGYLIGSVNFAILYSKLFKKDDVRKYGSGNAGATNVLRTYGKGPALLVFVLDLLKGIAAVCLCRLIYAGSGDILPCFAAFGAVLGHCFPCYHGFMGGKGISTSFAVLLLLEWRAALIALGVFIVSLLVSRYVSVSSMAAAVAAPIAAIAFHFVNGSVSTAVCVFTVCTGVLCVLRHSENIKRLRQGKEHRLGKRSA